MAKNRQHYREKISKMVSWGHWFSLFNIVLALLIGSRYLWVADWPGSLLGRVYAFCSWIGHFSFIVFVFYLLIVFPLTFIIGSQRLLKGFYVILATAGLTFLLIDSVVFNRFHLHLNPIVWQLLISPLTSEMSRDWQMMFIAAPIIFLIEMLLATWCWQKLRSLNRRRFVKPIVFFFISCFFATHLLFSWADANFYRPITMQRDNLPLSYPMTARRFLEKHGYLDAKDYQNRLTELGDPNALSVEYPLNTIQYKANSHPYNLLLITLPLAHSLNDFPTLQQFAANNIEFQQHYSSGDSVQSGLFSLFYGISAGYLRSMQITRTPSALLKTLSDEGYQFGLFSANNFNQPLYRQALLADFALANTTQDTTLPFATRWKQWYAGLAQDKPWFSWINFDNTYINEKSAAELTSSFQQQIAQANQQIAQLLAVLQHDQLLDKTVVVFTASHSVAESKVAIIAEKQRVQVPLLIHWPATPAQKIQRLTTHSDLMTTLMERLLKVTNDRQDYSQGQDLFSPTTRKVPWATSIRGDNLLINTSQLTLVLKKNGSYDVFDKQGNKLAHHAQSLGLLLELITEEKRFLAN